MKRKDKLSEIENLMDKYDIKNLSMLESALICFVSEYDEKERSIIDKKLKVLEIIKRYTNNSGIHIDFNKIMKATVKNFDYTTMTYIVDEELIKEFELLKEVLL